jgi:small subunit ribosomal protein S18
MATKKRRKTRKPPAVKQNCPFCKKNISPDYKDYKNLANFLTDRAKIVGKNRSGLCSKHQRKLGAEIKRARHLGLLPFASEM